MKRFIAFFIKRTFLTVFSVLFLISSVLLVTLELDDIVVLASEKENEELLKEISKNKESDIEKINNEISDNKQDDLEEEKIILDGKIENRKKNAEKKTKKNGWYSKKISNKIMYKYKKEGSKKFAKGRVKIGKNHYYFNENGYLEVNKWIKKNNKKTYYCDKKGKLAKEWVKISNFYYYFDKSNKLSQNLIKKFGEKWYKKQNIMIKINKYHNCITIYGKSNKKSKSYDMPIYSFPCTSGYATRLLTTDLKKQNTYRWHTLMGPSYGQFCTRIHKGMLFHSVLYRRPNKYALNARTYNKLGITASHGCVRLAVVDAKRIYDDVRRMGTVKLNIYNDKNSVGPFDKPNYKKVGYNQKHDPTDPTI